MLKRRTVIRESIQADRHFEIASSELAKWLEEHAPDSWWNIDGDPLLTGRLYIPCPTDELALELRTLNRPLLVLAKDDPDAKGQIIDTKKFNALTRFAGKINAPGRFSPLGQTIDSSICAGRDRNGYGFLLRTPKVPDNFTKRPPRRYNRSDDAAAASQSSSEDQGHSATRPTASR